MAHESYGLSIHSVVQTLEKVKIFFLLKLSQRCEVRNCPVCECERSLEKSFLFGSANMTGKEAKPQGRSKLLAASYYKTRKNRKA